MKSGFINILRILLILSVFNWWCLAQDPFVDLKVGRQGNAEVVINAGSFKCGGDELPLTLTFDGRGQGSPDLPVGWSLRLLELNSFLTSETQASVRLPNGENVPVTLGAENGGADPNARTVSINGDDLVIDHRGTKYHYKKGLIRKVESALGVTYFRYEAERLKVIQSGDEVLEIFETDQGPDKTIKLVKSQALEKNRCWR